VRFGRMTEFKAEVLIDSEIRCPVLVRVVGCRMKDKKLISILYVHIVLFSPNDFYI
jgi:hypothetical protein